MLKKNIPDDEGVAGAFAQQVNSRGFCLACFHLRDSRYSPPSYVLLGIHVWGCRVFFIQCAALKIYDRSVKNDSVNSSVRGWSGAAH